MLSQQLLVRYNQTAEYGKKDLEDRLKEVEAGGNGVKNPMLAEKRLRSVVQTSVEVTESSPPGQVVCTSVARDRFN